MENLAKIINIGSLINEGLENGDKQNKQNVQTYIELKIKTFVVRGKIPKFYKSRAFQ